MLRSSLSRKTDVITSLLIQTYLPYSIKTKLAIMCIHTDHISISSIFNQTFLLLNSSSNNSAYPPLCSPWASKLSTTRLHSPRTSPPDSLLNYRKSISLPCLPSQNIRNIEPCTSMPTQQLTRFSHASRHFYSPPKSRILSGCFTPKLQ